MRKVFRYILVFYLIFALSIFDLIYAIKVYAACSIYCPKVSGPYPQDLVEYDFSSGFCFYPPIQGTDSTSPCPFPYLYDSVYKKCKAYPQCTSNCIWNPETKMCEEVILPSSPSSGFLYNETDMLCVKTTGDEDLDPSNTIVEKCIELNVNGTTQYLCPIDLVSCVKESSFTCPSGSELDPDVNVCYTSVSTSCPSGSSLDSSGNVCYTSVTASCPSGSNYNPSTGRCESDPVYVNNVNQVIQHISANFGILPGKSCSYNQLWSCVDYCYNLCFDSENPEGCTEQCVTDRCCHPGEIQWDSSSVSFVAGTCGGGIIGTYTTDPGCYSNAWTFKIIYPHLINWAGLDYFGGVDSAIFYINNQQYHSGGETCGNNKDLTNIFRSFSPGSEVTVKMTVCTNARLAGLYGKFRINISPGYACSIGTYDQSSGKCVTYPNYSCPSGFTYNSSTNRCETYPSSSCPSGFTYNSSTNRCEAPPEGSEVYTCPYSGRPCIDYNGQKVCSPYDCGRMEDTDTPDEPPSGLEEDQNYEQGVCQGTIYIFNGKKMRCRPSGLQTGFHNCCDEAKGRLYDSTGSTGMALGDAIRAMYVAMEIIKQAKLIAQVAKVQVITDAAGNVGSVVLLGKNDVGITTFVGDEAKVWANAVRADGVAVPATSGLPGYEIINKNELFTNYVNNYIQTFAPQLAAQLVVLALTKAIDDPILSAAVNLVAQAILVKLGLATPIGIYLAALELALALFTPRCDTQDILTSTYKESGYCHYVGSRCIKKILGSCVQKSKVYCCFNSKLARIIHEQGRPQLTTFGPGGGWGSAKRPNCRGFTPEEFQAIDFGRIDFSEYIEDIQRNIRRNIEPQIQQIFEETIKTTYPGQPY